MMLKQNCISLEETKEVCNKILQFIVLLPTLPFSVVFLSNSSDVLLFHFFPSAFLWLLGILHCLFSGPKEGRLLPLPFFSLYFSLYFSSFFHACAMKSFGYKNIIRNLKLGNLVGESYWDVKRDISLVYII